MKLLPLQALCLCYVPLSPAQPRLHVETLGNSPDALVLPCFATPGEAYRDLGAAVVRANTNGQCAGLRDYTLQLAPGGRHYLHRDEREWTHARTREALAGGDDH